MKLINCTWEKENLDRDVCEIELNMSDVLSGLSNTIREVEEQYNYIVIKSSINNFEMTKLLEEHGYNFIETQLSMKKRIKNLNFNDKAIRFITKLVKFTLVEDGLDLFLDHIDNDMFNTDRIYIDNQFGNDRSKIRYCNWIRSEFNKNNKLYSIKFNDLDIGFILLKKQDNKIVVLLAGIFSKYKHLNLGLSIILGPLLLCKEMECVEVVTKVSSNNLEVFKLYNYFNFEVTNFNYVFTKHL